MMKLTLHLLLLQVLIAFVCYGTATAFLDVIVSNNKNDWGPLAFSMMQQERHLLPPFRRCHRGGKCHIAAAASTSSSSSASDSSNKKLSESDKDRLLLTEPALNAFIVAEMRHFVSEMMREFDSGERPSYAKWKMDPNEKVAAGLIRIVTDENTGGPGEMSGDDIIITNTAYAEALDRMNKDGALAVDLICNATAVAFEEGFNEGLLTALGSAILFFRNYYREPELIAACERVGLSDYAVAHHITDMYHHRSFRGTYTKTLAPSGMGEIAARIAVGLPLKDEKKKKRATSDQGQEEGNNGQKPTDVAADDEDDECLLWSPTTPGVCLHWKSEDDAWRQKRFERIQMEGTRDPRRGGSGTSR